MWDTMTSQKCELSWLWEFNSMTKSYVSLISFHPYLYLPTSSQPIWGGSALVYVIIACNYPAGHKQMLHGHVIPHQLDMYTNAVYLSTLFKMQLNSSASLQFLWNMIETKLTSIVSHEFHWTICKCIWMTNKLCQCFIISVLNNGNHTLTIYEKQSAHVKRPLLD